MTKRLERTLFEFDNSGSLGNSPFHRDEFTVDMSDGKYVEGDGRLKTYGLGGCYVTLIYTERDGEKQGLLTHYPQTATDANVAKLRQLVGERPDMRNAYLKRAVILHEDDSFSPESTKRYNSQVLSMLECGIKAALGDDTQIGKKIYHGSVSASEGHREVYLLLASSSWSSFIGGEKFR